MHRIPRAGPQTLLTLMPTISAMQPLYQQLQDPLFNQNSNFDACNGLEINSQLLYQELVGGGDLEEDIEEEMADINHPCNNFYVQDLLLSVP